MLRVEPRQLLSDLLDLSGQVEAATIVTRAGALVASTVPEDQANAVGDAVSQLAASASAVGSPTDEHLVQLQITLEEGCVFLAQDDEHAVGCTTVPHPTAGLVFYDLKTTLRRLAGDHDELVPKSRAWDGAADPAEGDGS